MCKLNKVYMVDKCMVELISFLSRKGIKTFACCCGHGKYAKTIVSYSRKRGFFDLISGVMIPRIKRFYKKDEEGFYYIPEVEDFYNKICE